MERAFLIQDRCRCLANKLDDEVVLGGNTRRGIDICGLGFFRLYC